MEILPFIFMLAGVPFALMILQQQRQRRDEAWRVFALAHELSFEPSTWTKSAEIYGAYEGVRVRLSVVWRGGKNKTPYTTVEAYAGTSLPPGFYLSRESVIASMGKMLGGQDIQVGDPELDGAFIIRGRSERRVRELLSQRPVRNRLLAWIRENPSAELEEGRVRWSKRGYLTEPLKMEEMVREAVEVITSLDQGALRMREQPLAQLQQILDEDDPVDVERALAWPGPTDAEAPRPAGGPSAPFAPAGRLGADGAAGAPAAQASAADWRAIAERFMASTSIEGVELPGGDRITPLPDLSPVDGGGAPPLPGVAAVTTAPPALEPAPPPKPRMDRELSDALNQLADRRISSGDRGALIRGLQGRRFRAPMTVERVSWSSGMGLPEALRSGRTVIGGVGVDGLQLGARFSKDENDRLSKLTRGDGLEVEGVVSGWDDFYRRLVMDVT